MKRMFSTGGRVNRARYALATLLVPIAGYIVASIVAQVDGTFGPVLAVVMLVALQVMVVCQTIQRLHDIGRSGHHFWLLLIPFYNVYLSLVLLFKRGDRAPNSYGPDPLVTHPELVTA